jgi:H+/gluconate symporter-like permease
VAAGYDSSTAVLTTPQPDGDTTAGVPETTPQSQVSVEFDLRVVLLALAVAVLILLLLLVCVRRMKHRKKHAHARKKKKMKNDDPLPRTIHKSQKHKKTKSSMAQPMHAMFLQAGQSLLQASSMHSHLQLPSSTDALSLQVYSDIAPALSINANLTESQITCTAAARERKKMNWTM